MARPTISQRIALEGGEQIRRSLAELGRAGETAFAQLQRAGESVNLNAPAAAIEAASRRTSAAVDELRQRMIASGSAAAQSGAGYLQFGGAVQATHQRLAGAVNIGVRAGLALQGLGTSFSGAFGRVREFGTGVTSAFQSMGANVLRSVATLTAVPAAFFAVANSAADAAAKIKEASTAAGTSPQEYQKLAIAAEQMGGSEEKLVLALSVINERVQDQSQNFFRNRQRLEELRQAMAAGGLAGRQAAQDYESLRNEMELFGPAVQQGGEHVIDVERALKSLGPANNDAIERLKGFADEIAGLPTPAERAARTIEIFGRRLGPQLVELLSGGRAAIDDIGNRAERLGLIMKDVEFKLAKDMTDALALLRRSIGATRNSVSLLFAPAIIEAAEMFTEAIGRNRTDLILWAGDVATKVRPVLLDLVRALTGDVEAIETGWVRTARQLIVDLGAAIANVTQNIIMPAFTALLALLQTTAEAINGIFGTKLTAVDLGVVLIVGKMFGAFTLLAGVLRLVTGAFGTLRAVIAALPAIGNVLLAAFRAVGGALGLVRLAVVGLIAAFGAVPIAIAAVGAAIGFLAVQLARAVNWSAFAERARAAFNAVLEFVSELAAGITDAFQSVVSAMTSAWNAIVSAAQTAFTTILGAASAAWGALKELWQAGVAALAGVWDEIVASAQATFDQITAAVGTLWAGLNALWQSGTQAIVAVWEALKGSAVGAWQSILDGLDGAIASLVGLWNAGVARVTAFLTTLRDFAVGVWSAIAEAARNAFGAEQQAAGAASGFSRGGPVFGAGTAVSDSIPAWLSNGEFVIRAAAVRKYGSSLFDALNRMRIDPTAFGRFAEGGLVRSLQFVMPAPMRFADGGLVPAPATNTLRPINLQIGSELFAGMLAPDDVAQKLLRVAVTRQVRSAGRKPSYYGKGR